MLHAVGLTPDAMTAAGVNATQATASLNRIREQLPQLASQFDAAHDAFGAARIETDRLQRLVRSGVDSTQNAAALVSVRLQIQAATAQRDAAIQAFLRTAELGLEVNARLAIIRDRRCEGIPTQYLAASQPETDLLPLRHALASAAIHTRLGEDVPPGVRATILASDSNPAVATASTRLQANQAAVAAAWMASVGLP